MVPGSLCLHTAAAGGMFDHYTRPPTPEPGPVVRGTRAKTHSQHAAQKRGQRGGKKGEGREEVRVVEGTSNYRRGAGQRDDPGPAGGARGQAAGRAAEGEGRSPGRRRAR